MRKLSIFLGIIISVFLFSCEPKKETCKICSTILKYPSTDIMLLETVACGEILQEIDGRFVFAINPMTGEVLYFIMTTCK